MNAVNPQAVLLVAVFTVAGFLAGSWAWGCLVGLLLVLAATWWPLSPVDDAIYRLRRRRR